MATYAGLEITDHSCQPFSALVLGNASTGKRTFVHKFLGNYRKLRNTSAKANLVYFAPNRPRPEEELLVDYLDKGKHFPNTLQEFEQALDTTGADKEVGSLVQKFFPSDKTVYVIDALTGDGEKDSAIIELAYSRLFKHYDRLSCDIIFFITSDWSNPSLRKIVETCTNLILFKMDSPIIQFTPEMKIEPDEQFFQHAWGYALRKKYGYLNIDLGSPEGNRDEPKYYNGLYIEPGVLEMQPRWMDYSDSDSDAEDSYYEDYSSDEYTGESSFTVYVSATRSKAACKKANSEKPMDCS